MKSPHIHFTIPDKPWQVDYPLEAGRYKVTLLTTNACGDTKNNSVEFNYAPCEFGPPIEIDPEIILYPNPIGNFEMGAIRITGFRAEDDVDLKSRAVSSQAGGTLRDMSVCSDDHAATARSIEFDATELQPGMNYLYIVSDGKVFVKQIKKQ